MGALESAIWHFLGYSLIPLIFLGGILISSMIYFILLELTGRGADD